jgi:hypothetical protein
MMGDRSLEGVPISGRFHTIPIALIFLIAFSTILITYDGGGETAQVGGGYLGALVSSEEENIWRADSENSPNNTSVTLTVSGQGTKGITLAPQDVVFIMDHSGSLQTFDPQVLRILGARAYVENMIAPFDRAAVIKFDNTASLFNHLSSAYAQVYADLEALARSQPQGQTNFQSAIDLVNTEFETFGKEGNQKIAVFFTDGRPDPSSANVTLAQMDRLVSNEIKLFTIGLGSELDEDLLKWMAWYTEGQFFKAETAQELVNIYMKISDQFYNYTAGKNVTLNAYLSEDLEYVHGSVNLTDGFSLNLTDGHALTWKIPDLEIGQNWSVSFRIRSENGLGEINVFNSSSGIEYQDWRGTNRTEELPSLYVNVIRSLPPPLPPPPPPPPAVAPAPIPPPPSVPVVAPTVNVAPVITAAPNITPVTIGQTATVPVEYLLGGLAALGIAKRTAIRKKIVEKQKVGVGA